MMEWSRAISLAGLAILMAASTFSCKRAEVSNISGTLRASSDGKINLETDQEGFSFGITGINEIAFDDANLVAFKKSRGEKDLEWTPATVGNKEAVFAASAKRGRWLVQSGSHQITLENGHSYLVRIHDGGIDFLKSDSEGHSGD